MANHTHGAHWLAARLEANRLEPRVRRMLRKIERELATNPWEAVVALTRGRIARRELLAQQREAALLADPTGEGGKWLLGLWAAQRRDLELLALLEKQQRETIGTGTRCANCGEPLADASAYLRHRCANEQHDTPAVEPGER